MSDSKRIDGLDLLRGLIMVFMSLDHFIYFLLRFHAAEFWNTSYPAFPADFLRSLRLLSHLCAPGFVFLAGLSMQLSFYKQTDGGIDSTRAKLNLLRRGGFIMLLQLLLEPIAWLLGELGGRGVPLTIGAVPGTGSAYIYLGVLYAIGASMLIGTLFLNRKTYLPAICAAIILICSPFLLRLYPDPAKPIPWFAGMLFSAGTAPPFSTNYPLLPWLGIFLAGLAAARLVRKKGNAINPVTVSAASLILIGAGIALRFAYPWGESHRADGTFLSFFELSKYPPSPAFLALALGVDGLFLALFLAASRQKSPAFDRMLSPLRIIGREPLFFYFLHLFFYGLLCLVLVFPPKPLPALTVWPLSLALLVFITRRIALFRMKRKNR